jgi:hypothetical protein
MIGRGDLPQPPSSPQGGASKPRRTAVRAATRTVAMFGAFVLAVWVTYVVGEWWIAFVLIGAIFAISGMLAVRRR